MSLTRFEWHFEQRDCWVKKYNYSFWCGKFESLKKTNLRSPSHLLCNKHRQQRLIESNPYLMHANCCSVCNLFEQRSCFNTACMQKLFSGVIPQILGPPNFQFIFRFTVFKPQLEFPTYVFVKMAASCHPWSVLVNNPILRNTKEPYVALTFDLEKETMKENQMKCQGLFK